MPMTDVITWDGEEMTATRAAALLAAVTTVAATSACTSTGSKTASATSAPVPVATSSATSIPTMNATTSPSATSASPSAAPSSASFTADYGNYVADAWLTSDQLPFVAAIPWKGDGQAPVGGKGAIQQDWYSCNTPAWFAGFDPARNGVQTVAYTAPPGKPQAQLAEQLVFFADPQTAEKALAQITADYTACAAKTRDTAPPDIPVTISLKKTATIDHGFAYLHTARKADGSPEGVNHWGTDAHEYFVQRGNVVVLVTLYAVDAAGGKAIDVTAADQAILQQTADHLMTAYAKS
jgi:hypothetical protein